VKSRSSITCSAKVIMVSRSRARKPAKRPLIEVSAPVRFTSACFSAAMRSPSIDPDTSST
jgi:hypothetical protein